MRPVVPLRPGAVAALAALLALASLHERALAPGDGPAAVEPTAAVGDSGGAALDAWPAGDVVEYDVPGLDTAAVGVGGAADDGSARPLPAPTAEDGLPALEGAEVRALALSLAGRMAGAAGAGFLADPFGAAHVARGARGAPGSRGTPIQAPSRPGLLDDQEP